MKTKFFTLFAAFVLLFSANASAQTNGDVNGDGKVNEQDIAAILKIMAEAGGVKEQTKYYWYVGTTNPTTMTSITPIVTDNSSTGWRYIGTSVPQYSAASPLFNADTNNIAFARNYYYIAVPNSAIKIYNVANGSVMDGYNTTGTVTIGGVVYTIYASINKASGFIYKLF